MATIKSSRRSGKKAQKIIGEWLLILTGAKAFGHERSIVELHWFCQFLIKFSAEASCEFGPRCKIAAERIEK